MHTLKVDIICTICTTAPSGNPLVPAIVSLVVLLLITCVALLVLALAMTATKLNTLMAEKGHTDLAHYYNQTGGGERRSIDGIYNEVGEGTGPIEGQSGPYQELEVETMEQGQYATLQRDSSAKA